VLDGSEAREVHPVQTYQDLGGIGADDLLQVPALAAVQVTTKAAARQRRASCARGVM